MTRGLKGCYVYFVDKETEIFFRSHIQTDPALTKEKLYFSDIISHEDEVRTKIEDSVPRKLQFAEYLPVYALEAACGLFGRGNAASCEGWVKVNKGPLNKNMFVSKVIGKSMEPKIPSGSYCIFQANIVGSRMNKIVLVQHNNISDIDTGGQYTVKKYTSKKVYSSDGSWEHEEIILLPINPIYEPIIIPTDNDGELMVVAEFISILT